MTEKNETVEVLISAEKIEARVNELAEQIKKDYEGKVITLIGILKGGFIFIADLARKLGSNVELDFLRAASYGMDSVSSGKVHMEIPPSMEFKDKHLLLVEDIVDTGTTLAYIVDYLKDKEPASLKICAFLDKPDRRTAEGVKFDYLGFTIPDEFVVGFGMDYAQRYRNLPYVGAIKFN